LLGSDFRHGGYGAITLRDSGKFDIIDRNRFRGGPPVDGFRLRRTQGLTSRALRKGPGPMVMVTGLWSQEFMRPDALRRQGKSSNIPAGPANNRGADPARHGPSDRADGAPTIYLHHNLRPGGAGVKYTSRGWRRLLIRENVQADIRLCLRQGGFVVVGLTALPRESSRSMPAAVSRAGPQRTDIPRDWRWKQIAGGRQKSI